jgi:hypothetical protein
VFAWHGTRKPKRAPRSRPRPTGRKRFGFWGCERAGGNHAVLKRWAERWGITTEHFAPYVHVGAHLRTRRIPLDEILVVGSDYTRKSLKQRLYEAGLKLRACELCGQGEIWRGQRMSLILDHVNGVHDDNPLLI